MCRQADDYVRERGIKTFYILVYRLLEIQYVYCSQRQQLLSLALPQETVAVSGDNYHAVVRIVCNRYLFTKMKKFLFVYDTEFIVDKQIQAIGCCI